MLDRRLRRSSKLLVAGLIGLVLLGTAAFSVFLADRLLSLWHQLQTAPLWLALLIGGALTAVLGAGIGLLFWILRPARKRPPGTAQAPLNEAELNRRLQDARDQGLDIRAVEAELTQLRERRAAGEIHLALFGEISTGKSSIVGALVPGSEPVTAVSGGTTRSLVQYRWQSPAGDALVVTDMPGLNEPGDPGHLAREEAARAHLVIYVIDSDLSASQQRELAELHALGKPMIVALNKADRYDDRDLPLILSRVRERLQPFGSPPLVAISAGGRRLAVRLLPDGSEEEVWRPLPPQLDSLRELLQRRLDDDPVAMRELRDAALFQLAGRKLAEAEAARRREEADRIVHSYSRKAIGGAMAAMTPGADLVIQGWLATQMVRELGTLYRVEIRSLDLDLLLELVQQQVKRHLTLLLAIAGNALKAFPGLGTLAGGALHAVAYGMLFESLGRSVAGTLESRGSLRPRIAAASFEESLHEDLGATASRLARLAWQGLGREQDR